MRRFILWRTVLYVSLSLFHIKFLIDQFRYIYIFFLIGSIWIISYSNSNLISSISQLCLTTLFFFFFFLGQNKDCFFAWTSTHYSCERSKYAFIVFKKYLIIFQSIIFKLFVKMVLFSNISLYSTSKHGTSLFLYIVYILKTKTSQNV